MIGVQVYRNYMSLYKILIKKINEISIKNKFNNKNI